MTPMLSRLLLLLALVVVPAVSLAAKPSADKAQGGASAAKGKSKGALKVDAGAGNEATAKAAKTDTMSPEDAAKFFNDALGEFYAANYMYAATQFYVLLSRTGPNFDNYGWAQYFLAECFANLGMWHAAVVYYYLVAKTRSQPEVLPTTLSRLEAITRERPFDEDLVYEQLIYNSDFGILPPALSSWVFYVQGLFDYEQNFIEWGDKHFGGIDPASRYRLDGLYVQAVWNVRERRDKEAEALMRTIVDSPVKSPVSKNQSRLALARLLFERGKYNEAIAMYDQVEQIDLSYEQGQILTEKAWSAYYVQDYPKALGFLHALGAPSYESFFYPDTYLLKALIFKDMCHYLSAKNVVRAFKFKFGRAMEQLKQRLPMERIERIRRASIMDGSIARRTRLLQTLRSELRLLSNTSSTWNSTGLERHVRTLYDEALEQQDRRWRRDFKVASDRVALRLLDTAEQVSILDYEVSLAIYKPLDDREATIPEDSTAAYPELEKNVFYAFDGEYWNDELRNFQFLITSRCIGRDK